MLHYNDNNSRRGRRFWALTAGASMILVGAGCGGGGGPQLPRPIPTPTPTTPPGNLQLLVTDGNSLTDGHYSTYPALLMAQLGSGWTLRNFGVSGQTTPQMSKDAKTQIDSLRRAGKTDVLVAWEITNDLIHGAERDQAYERFRSYCQARREAGWKVVALTVLPRARDGLKPKFEDARTFINADMRRNWRSFADALADVAAGPQIGDFGDQLNLTYYSDGTHLTGQGYAIVANIVAAQVRVLTPTQAQLQ